MVDKWVREESWLTNKQDGPRERERNDILDIKLGDGLKLYTGMLFGFSPP